MGEALREANVLPSPPLFREADMYLLINCIASGPGSARFSNQITDKLQDEHKANRRHIITNATTI
jgi:hypothetical protein